MQPHVQGLVQRSAIGGAVVGCGHERFLFSLSEVNNRPPPLSSRKGA